MISVIISIYNVAPYIQKCIESIQNQTYYDLEIIAVDDGSTDESGQLCEKMAALDQRIRVIHKSNGGNSSARNAGIDAARGDFLAFVDGDDYVEANMYEILLKEMDNSKVTIVAGGIITTTLEGKDIVTVSKESKYFTKEEALLDLFDGRGTILPTACNKLYRRELFANYRFDNDIIHEDTGLMPALFDACNGVMVCNKALYHYIKRKNSASTSRLYNLRSYRFMNTVWGYRSMCKEKYPELLCYYAKYEINTTYEMLVNLAGCSNWRDFKRQERYLRRKLLILILEQLRYINTPASQKNNLINYLIMAIGGCSFYNK